MAISLLRFQYLLLFLNKLGRRAYFISGWEGLFCYSENCRSQHEIHFIPLKGAELLEAAMCHFVNTDISARHKRPNTEAFFLWHESLLHTVTVTQTKTGTQTQEIDSQSQCVTHHFHSCGNKKALYSPHANPLSVVVPARWHFWGILSLVQIWKITSFKDLNNNSL